MPLTRSRIVGAALVLCAVVESESVHAGERQVCDQAYAKAQDLRDAKKLMTARDQLRVCARKVCRAFIVKDCATWLAEVEGRLPSVVLVANDPSGNALPSVTVSIDGAPSPRNLDGTSWDIDPGPHTFTFVAADGTKTEKSVIVAEGQKAQRIVVSIGAPLPVALAVARPAESGTGEESSDGHGQRVAAFAVGGVGVVGIGLGAVFGGLALSKWGSAKSACPTFSGCSATATSERASSVSFGTVSDVGFIAGGAMLAAAVTLYLTAPKGPSATVGIEVVPGGLRVGGSF